MRFMILVKATAATEAGAIPDASLFAAMDEYHDALAQAGVLLDAAGLQPSAKGWRIDYAQGQRLLTEGPFVQDGGMVAGYTLIQVRSRDEALEWSRRFPSLQRGDVAAQIEVRQLFEPVDFASSPAVMPHGTAASGAGGA
jgi:hypothetical protein